MGETTMHNPAEWFYQDLMPVWDGDLELWACLIAPVHLHRRVSESEGSCWGPAVCRRAWPTATDEHFPAHTN